MDFTTGFQRHQADITALVQESFGTSEGAEEGTLVAGLAADLMNTTPQDDLLVCCAHDGDMLIGCIMFSRLSFDGDDQTVFLLSPVAIRTRFQKQGVGQALLRFGIAQMRQNGVDVLMTYGSPDYYGKVGFQPVSEDAVTAPLPLSYPHGWIGQSLRAEQPVTIQGTPVCVPALQKPEFW